MKRQRNGNSKNDSIFELGHNSLKLGLDLGDQRGFSSQSNSIVVFRTLGATIKEPMNEFLSGEPQRVSSLTRKPNRLEP